MLSFLARLVGGLLLAAAVVFAIGDIARSLTGTTIELQTLGDAAAAFGLAVPHGSESLVGAAWVTAAPWPASVSLAVAAFVFLLVGQTGARPRRRLVR
ncbi:hypothetical protein NPA31_013360 [Aurantimonas sp. MSK8Z-1]|uniref:hypothetical protein n=1 Tax=Mangrovibrevibacter kandeliae TaxID=2968473 RepID=UPI0021196B73|nr:hypothetical protein [Aurantimonas sp. MSK8Z-1]MCW4115947.1 hypothetical protein [Aurantimonas sp. MSK8Z-1]